MTTATAQTIAPTAWLPEGTPPALSAAPAWLAEQQASALTDYHHTGLPGVRDEQWRYTNLRALKNAALRFAEQPNNDLILENTNSVRLVFSNGFFIREQSNVEGLPEGVICTNLSNALQDHAEQLKAAYATTLPKEQHGFHLLNSAYHNDGFVLIVPKGCVVEQPIEVIISVDDGVVSHARNLVLAGANSQCTVVERHGATRDSATGGAGYLNSCYLNNSITEIVAEDGAHIDHYKLHSESDSAFHIGGVFINQAANSQVKNHNIALNGKLVRNDIVARLNGQGSHIEMNGLVLGSQEQHVDNHTEVLHAVANCTSDEFYKTVLDDKSRSVFRGRIIVAQDAQLTVADQQNKNLLLSSNAEADTKPQLEIYADDVKCSHGATVGQLDPKSVFYLQSRGINESAALALLTFAFANEVVERIQVPSVRESLTKLIAGELVSDLETVL